MASRQTGYENFGEKFQLDHIVHLVQEVDSVASLMNAAGFYTVMGGRHLDWGTANALCHFGLSYIEFLGIENWSLAGENGQNDLVQQAANDLKVGEGLARIAIRTSDIQATADKLRQQGLRIVGPLLGQRQRPDGRVLRWSLLFVQSPLSALPLPFFIQWEDRDEERMLDLGKRGVIREHLLGKLEIREIAFVTREPERTVRLWEQWFGLRQNSALQDALSLSSGCHRLWLGEVMLNFCTPARSTLATEVFEKRGERPYAIRFTGANQGKRATIGGAEYQAE